MRSRQSLSLPDLVRKSSWMITEWSSAVCPVSCFIRCTRCDGQRSPCSLAVRSCWIRLLSENFARDKMAALSLHQSRCRTKIVDVVNHFRGNQREYFAVLRHLVLNTPGVKDGFLLTEPCLETLTPEWWKVDGWRENRRSRACTGQWSAGALELTM